MVSELHVIFAMWVGLWGPLEHKSLVDGVWERRNEKFPMNFHSLLVGRHSHPSLALPTHIHTQNIIIFLNVLWFDVLPWNMCLNTVWMVVARCCNCCTARDHNARTNIVYEMMMMMMHFAIVYGYVWGYTCFWDGLALCASTNVLFFWIFRLCDECEINKKK